MGREGNPEKGKCKLPIGDTSNGALLKLHHVAGEGPRLVRENVFHLDEENKKIHLFAFKSTGRILNCNLVQQLYFPDLILCSSSKVFTAGLKLD